MAEIARASLRFPDHYALYSLKEFTWNGIRQTNRNRLLWRDPTVDGLKTGHTAAAGYCLVTSARRDGMRLISVVMGADSEAARDRETQKMLAYGFRYFETLPLYQAGAELSQSRVWGTEQEARLGVAEAVSLTIPRGQRDHVEAVMNINQVIRAPVAEGDVLGEMVVSLGEEELLRRPLVALEDVAQGGLFKRLWDGLLLLILGLFRWWPRSTSTPSACPPIRPGFPGWIGGSCSGMESTRSSRSSGGAPSAWRSICSVWRAVWPRPALPLRCRSPSGDGSSSAWWPAATSPTRRSTCRSPGAWPPGSTAFPRAPGPRSWP